MVFSLLFIQNIFFGQAPTLGTAANFVLFTSVGAVTNTGITQLTGNVGSNIGSSTGFGNVDGVMHNGNGVTAQCGADLLIAYNQLNSATPNYFLVPLLGNGQILTAGTYSIMGVTTLNLDLILDAQGDPNAVFIFQIEAAFATNANSEIKLTNGAKACNVFWKIEGLTSMASGTIMKGTVIVNNAAIVMSTGVSLEGRALSTTGAISVDGIVSRTPLGCGSLILNGPIAPDLKATEYYAIFSSNGAVSNVGITNTTGDVGTNLGLTTGFDALLVNGNLHTIPDISTAQTAADLIDVNNYLNALPFDIELLYPAQFGNNLVLTPHTYLLNAATILTNTIYLNAQDNPNAVFVIKINGAFSTSTFAKIILINGTQAKNVYWKVDGAVLISDYSEFKGTIIANNGAVDLTTGVTLDGRIFTTTGALTSEEITVIIPSGFTNLGTQSLNKYKNIAVYPNPFYGFVNVAIEDNLFISNTYFVLYDIFGKQVKKESITTSNSIIEVNNLASGIYLFKIMSNEKIIQSGKLLAQ